jgi:CRISPR-associated endonuclease Cas2
MKVPKRIRRFVVAYDICVKDDSYIEKRNSTKRRTKVMRILYDYGIRTQLSVFEVSLSGKQYVELIERVRSVLRKETDKVFIYPLDSASFGKVVRLGKEPEILGDIFL